MMNKNLKILIFWLIAFILNFSTFLLNANPWQIVDKRPDISKPYQNSNYLYLKFADSLNGMVAANLGGAGGYYIRRTSDGGNTWKTVLMDSAYFYSPSNKKFVPKIKNISYPNLKFFIAVGDSGLILRTTDIGETWQEKRLDTNLLLVVSDFYDELNGVVFGCTYSTNYDDCPFYTTTDGGETWTKCYWLPKIYPVNHINENLFCGLLWIKNTDSTSIMKLVWVYKNWEKVDTLPLPNEAMGLSFPDENNGWFISDTMIGGSSPIDYKYNQLIYHTSDGGHNWEKQWDTVIEYQPLNDIKFYDENFGIASGFLGLMLVTTNGGKKWKVEYVDDTVVTNGYFYYMDQIQIVSPTTAFVLGNFDYVYKYNRELDNFDDVAVAEPPKQNSLTISPNPSSDYIEINVGVQNFEPLQDNIRIYNVLGETVLNISATGSETKIDISAFPSGLYFVRVGGKVSKLLKI